MFDTFFGDYMKDKMLKLRSENLTYQQIADILGCVKSTVAYYLSDGVKEKSATRMRKRRKSHPYIKKAETFCAKNRDGVSKNQYYTKWQQLLTLKIQSFCRTHGKGKYMSQEFNYQDVVNKFGEKPKCYLTGEQLDIQKPRTYHFDHKIPRSRGGNNTIENLGIATKIANQAKQDLTLEEFVSLCESVLTNFGYKIEKPTK
jgi:predicted transcriptional regulator